MLYLDTSSLLKLLLPEPESAHIRTVDRLHLAAMQELEVSRLMTHDLALAQAARALGYEVLSPA